LRKFSLFLSTGSSLKLPLSNEFLFSGESDCFNRFAFFLQIQLLHVKKLLQHLILKKMLLKKPNKEQTMQIKWGKHFSEPFHVSNGVRQGGVLSPYLFAVYLDDCPMN